MRTHASAILVISGLALVASQARAQYSGDPGLDPRVAAIMQPPTPVDYQCEIRSQNGATDSAPNTWPGGVVPFMIDPSDADPGLTIRAMDIWMFRQNSPNVTFIKRDPSNPAHNNYVLVQGVQGPVSDSPVGMIGGQGVIHQGSQVNDYVMAHELCHTLGFWHEHTRPDRDLFIWVYYGRVYPQDYVHNFDIQPAWVPGSLNTGYDFDSVMHYGATTFMDPTCDLGLAGCLSVLTCTPLQARPDLGYGVYQCTMGQQSHLSTNDVQDMINVYGARPRPLSFVGPNGSSGSGTLSNPYSSPASAGGGGNVYLQGGSTYHVAAGTRFTAPATWKKHSSGVAVITAP